jgi:hypothetical protein
MTKTNAARILDAAGIPYELRSYQVDEDDLSAPLVAEKIGLPPEQVFKTLVARGDRNGVLMACIPANTELDLKAVAAALKAKRQVFEIDEDFRLLAELDRTADTNQTVTRKVWEQRHERVGIDHANTVDGGSNREQTILNLRQVLTCWNQNSARIPTACCGNSRESTHTCSATEEVLKVRP